MKLAAPTEEVLSNRASLGIVRALLERPARAQSGRAWARDSGVALPSALRELSRLADLGIVSVHEESHVHTWRLNPRHYLVPPLRQLIGAERIPQQVLEQLVRQAVRRAPGIREVILFGSRARGEATPESDVDLLFLVRSERDREACLPAMVDLLAKSRSRLGLSLSMLVYTAAEWASKREMPFAKAIRREGTALWRSPN